MNTLTASALVLFAVAACDRKNENRASETTTTSGPVTTPATPDEMRGGTTTTGSTMDFGKDASVDDRDTTMPPKAAAPTAPAETSQMGLGTSDMPSSRNGARKDGGSMAAPPTTARPTGAANGANGTERNTSTTLGDGTSGQYTGGAGAYGGPATRGTDPPKPSPAQGQGQGSAPR